VISNVEEFLGAEYCDNFQQAFSSFVISLMPNEDDLKERFLKKVYLREPKFKNKQRQELESQ
jgi:hypothetical protein